MYFKLNKFTPVDYTKPIKEEIAVATSRSRLVTHLRMELGRIAPIEEISFEQGFGYISKRPETEPWYEIERMDGLLMFEVSDT